MRELVYYVACSLDGFIAREDGSLNGFSWDDDYLSQLLESFPETFPAHFRGTEATRAENKLFDAVLMGRKTYETGVQEGVLSPYPTLDQYVFSRTLGERSDRQVELISDGAVEFVKELKQRSGKAIWLCGGAGLAAALFGAELIDRLILKVNPVLFGQGVPLFAGVTGETGLELVESRTFESGHVLLDYRVKQ